METQRPQSGAATLPEALELNYPVLVGAGAIEAAAEFCAPFDRVALLADETALGFHKDRLAGLHGVPTQVLPPGESSKEWTQLGQVLDFMADVGLSRRSLLLTFGGGVTSDLGGLAASLFNRGTSVGHLPTTLLSQVDASIGGKTAINLSAGKNLAGTFHAPRFVLADPSVLATQAVEEWQSGLGEVVKSALLARPRHFQTLEDAAGTIQSPNGAQTPEMAAIIQSCIQTKAQWVQEDPTEQGARKALNLGHTFAHALEHLAGYGEIPYGIAVGMGLVLATQTARAMGVLEEEDLEPRLLDLMKTLGLPRYPSEWKASSALNWNADLWIASFAHDKKGSVAQPRFVLPVRLGRVLWDQKVDSDLLRDVIDRWTQS
ncbi:MAG: 3-dehydroquinate synthase [Planctomycetes bacterium]|nr:3-dehydroquinate synthase [Planctomycetota bacterium]